MGVRSFTLMTSSAVAISLSAMPFLIAMALIVLGPWLLNVIFSVYFVLWIVGSLPSVV